MYLSLVDMSIPLSREDQNWLQNPIELLGSVCGVVILSEGVQNLRLYASPVIVQYKKRAKRKRKTLAVSDSTK